MAGTVKRAPKWMQKTGLEGIFRLIQQPQRIDLQLFSRYFYTIYIVLHSFIRK